jgi:DNA-binding PadR family transcriptional regulator
LNRDEIPPDTLCLLILKSLARHVKLHGYEIANSIQRTSDDVLQVEDGSLYPALQRRLIEGWGDGEMGNDGWKPGCALLQVDSRGAQAVGVGDLAV